MPVFIKSVFKCQEVRKGWWPKSACTRLTFSQLLSGQPHDPVCWRGCITLHWLRRGEQLSREKQGRAEEQRMHYSGQSSCSPTHPKAVLSIRDLASATANMCSFQWWCLLGKIFAFVGKSTKDELLLWQSNLITCKSSNYFHSGSSWAGLHKLWYPGIRDTGTWNKFGAHGEHGDVFLLSNLGALWFSENLIRYSLHVCLREVKNNLFSFRHPYLGTLSKTF